MRKLTITMMIALSVAAGPVSPLWAEMATIDEALTVANNWVSLVIAREGDWGGSQTAYVQSIQEFTRGDQVLGYFCWVEPIGFIVCSLHKELTPIKAYSDECNLDPAAETGMTDLLKDRMEGILDAIARQRKEIKAVGSASLSGIVKTDYSPVWQMLLGSAGTSEIGLQSGVVAMSYQGGEPPLLSSRWHQGPAYNSQCPDLDCNWCLDPDVECCSYNTKAPVGCAALATAQVMRHWAWPAYGEGGPPYTDEFQWEYMPDVLTFSTPGCTVDASQVNAVAGLCHEAGTALNSRYDCSLTTASGLDQLSGFKNNFRYAGADIEGVKILENVKFRSDHSDVQWFNLMKDALGENRPIPYNIPGDAHAVIADGWEEDAAGKRYHINYGWADESLTTWYKLDEVPGGDSDDYMLVNIRPSWAVGNQPSGFYSKLSYPYRYFDQDAEGASATFAAGQNLQFLPGVTVKCTGSGDDSIRFVGTSSDNTRLFSIKGTGSGGLLAEIKVYNGGIKLRRNGSLRFH